MRTTKSMISAICLGMLSFLGGCYFDPFETVTTESAGEGGAMMKLVAASNSSFHLIARSAEVTISASGMTTMVKQLTVTDTSVEGTIKNIPCGPSRRFQVDVYDSAHVVCYRGSASAEIRADQTALIDLILYRIGGTAIINGTISEDVQEIDPLRIPGLMAWYPFNGNAADESDHGFNAIPQNAELTADRFGNPDKAYYFNGYSSRISTTVTKELSLSKFTLCIWMKCDGVGSYLPRLLAVANSGDAMNYYGLLFGYGVWNHAPEVTRRLIFMNGFTNDYYGYNLQYSTGSVDTSAWHHAAVTYDSGRLRFYIDGMLDADYMIQTQIAQFSQTALLQIGCSDGGDRYVGKLDDARIYNRALSDEEIAAIYLSEY